MGLLNKDTLRRYWNLVVGVEYHWEWVMVSQYFFYPPQDVGSGVEYCRVTRPGTSFSVSSHLDVPVDNYLFGVSDASEIRVIQRHPYIGSVAPSRVAPCHSSPVRTVLV